MKKEEHERQQRIDRLEERLHLHLAVTKCVLFSIPFIAVIVYAVWYFRDFFNTYGLAIVLTVLSIAAFVALWGLALLFACNEWSIES
jgi:hypothetical protein